MAVSFQKGRKHCWKRRNCLLRAISPSSSVLKRLVLQKRKKQGLFGKGLIFVFLTVRLFLRLEVKVICQGHISRSPFFLFLNKNNRFGGIDASLTYLVFKFILGNGVFKIVLNQSVYCAKKCLHNYDHAWLAAQLH